MPRKKLDPVAGEEEVLAFYTSVMRGTLPGDAPPTVSEQCKAAEMLGRHYRLFEEKEVSRPDSAAAQAIRETMTRMREPHEG